MENITNIINDKKFSNNKIILENRKKAIITGVEKAISSNETSIILQVSGSKLFIVGTNLQIEKLDVESGEVVALGNFDGFKFGNSNKGGNFLKKVFK